ncbi:MAG: hypothetical protein A2Y55_04055 [Actinobacteria bacterium RBG_16_68_12]|nr:MAG: hypothetical protein A2Y55_04055 [Actinobacteria bacterium RBG_16_68_12]
MAAWNIGFSLGFGLGVGVIVSGLLAVSTRGLIAAALIAAALTAPFWINIGWIYVVADVVGAIVGAAAGSVVVRGALRRGGTRLGVAGYMALAGLGLIALSYVPLLGYVEVVAIALLAARVRRRDTKRFAGLRTLAK